MNEWIGIPDNIKDYQAYVYIITNKLNGRKYIGYKNYWEKKKLQPLKGRSKADKKRIAYQNSRSKTGKRNKRIIKRQTDWLDYHSSCEELKKDIDNAGIEHFERKILINCRTKMEALYHETRLQFEHEVLLSEKWYNDSIRCRFGGYVLRKCMKKII